MMESLLEGTGAGETTGAERGTFTEVLVGVATDTFVGVAMDILGEEAKAAGLVGVALKKCLMGVVITGGGLGNLRGAVSTTLLIELIPKKILCQCVNQSYFLLGVEFSLPFHMFVSVCLKCREIQLNEANEKCSALCTALLHCYCNEPLANGRPF